MADGLTELSYATLSIDVDGETWEFARLRQADFAQAAQFLRDMRHNDLYKRMESQMHDADTRAKVLIGLAAQPVTVHDLLDAPEGRAEMLRLSLKRGGRNMPRKDFDEKLPPMSSWDMWELCTTVACVKPNADPPPPPGGGTVTSPKSSTPQRQPNEPNEATSSPKNCATSSDTAD